MREYELQITQLATKALNVDNGNTGKASLYNFPLRMRKIRHISSSGRIIFGLGVPDFL